MKVLYLDLGMGAAGDMLAAALISLLPDPEGFISELNGIGIPGVTFGLEASYKCGITGCHMSVRVDGMEEESLDVHEHTHGTDHGDHDCCHGHGDIHAHTHGHGQEEEPGHNHGTGCACHTHDSTGDYTSADAMQHSHAHAHQHNHDHSHGHHHSSMQIIEHLVREHLCISDRVRDDVMAVYALLASAESHVHGVPVSDIHFHEVGTMDAVADITAVCLLMERIAPDRVIASPVHVGCGSVRCAHGIMPVPAPAAAELLKGIPVYGGRIEGELCTPTGAALVKYYVSEFSDMPVMSTAAIGYGMGKKDFEKANCLRAFLGESGEASGNVAVLSCNLDDMTPEAIGFAYDILFDEGALDVYTVAADMKKSRPGTILSVMCRMEDRERMAELIFKYTTTIGIREQILRRYTLSRSINRIETPYGTVRQKISRGYGTEKTKYEYDDIASIAKEHGLTLDEVISDCCPGNSKNHL